METDHKRQTDRASESRTATCDSVVRQVAVDQATGCATPSEFLDETIAVWQPHTDRSLTREDAREIVHNVVGFFRLLREWAEDERRSKGA